MNEMLRPTIPILPLVVWVAAATVQPEPAVAPAHESGIDESGIDESEIYARAMDRVLARAQTRLVGSITLRETRTWANPFEVKTGKYVTRSAKSHAQAHSVGMAMEQMAPLIQGLIKPDFTWPVSPLPIWIVPDPQTYNQIGNAGGDAHSSVYGSHLAAVQSAQPVVVLDQANEIMLKVLATHSAVHQFSAVAYPGSAAPAWIQEGLASYFSLYWSNEWGKSELLRFRSQEKQIPLSALLSRTPANYGQKAHQHFIELGMLFNYLLHYREDTRSSVGSDQKHDGPFADYLRKALGGANIADHPVQALLFREGKELQKAFLAEPFK